MLRENHRIIVRFHRAAALIKAIDAKKAGYEVKGCFDVASPGPVLYRQVRLGRNGRQFNVLKFRTMIPDADRLLEELPQLINVLKGDMSLVGPRRNDLFFAVGHHLSRAFSLDLLGDFLIKKREGYVYK